MPPTYIQQFSLHDVHGERRMFACMPHLQYSGAHARAGSAKVLGGVGLHQILEGWHLGIAYLRKF